MKNEKNRKGLFRNEQSAVRFYIVVTAVALAMSALILAHINAGEKKKQENPMELENQTPPAAVETEPPTPTAEPTTPPLPGKPGRQWPDPTPWSPSESQTPTPTPAPTPVPATPTPVPTPRVDRMTERQVELQAAEVLSGYAERVDATLKAPDTLILNATISRDKALEKLPKATAFVLKRLFPASVDGEIETVLSVSGGKLVTTIVRAEAMGKDVSGYLPEDTEEKLAAAISSALGEGQLAKVEVSSSEVCFTYK